MKTTYGSVDASPTKNFFVSMLTRDVSLLDAVLDLVDNCVDGILRNGLKTKKALPYSEYYAEITFDASDFYIHDNCGGIPWNLRDYAFRMGKPVNAEKNDVATVGVYGIGMKRAIFKMGRSCLIQTQSKKDCYELAIDSKWLENEEGNAWDLEARPSENVMDQDGTTILITDLMPPVSETFGKQKIAFESELIDAIETHYAQILDKGFTIRVNGKEVVARTIRLAFASQESKTPLRPYIYEADHDGVHVFLVVGFTRPLLDENEEKEERTDSRYSKERSGWTVICNDRVVVYADKTERTGWGMSRVPRYHPQFIAISGVVQFSSNDASKLPTVTTKRGLDMGSSLYLQVRERMIEGMKLFTDFTNQWKPELETAKRLIQATPLQSVSEIQQAVPKLSKSLKSAKRGIGGKYYYPKLPKPANHDPLVQKISYSKPVDEIDELKLFFYGEAGATPAEVGERAFVNALNEARRA